LRHSLKANFALIIAPRLFAACAHHLINGCYSECPHSLNDAVENINSCQRIIERTVIGGDLGSKVFS
jgi:hypothetical protein